MHNGKETNHCYSLGIIITSYVLVTLSACSSSPAPTTTPTIPPPTGTGPSVTININAENIAFDKGTITVPAGADVTVVFNNKDRVPHNVAFYETNAAAKAIFVGEVITGPDTVSYHFTAPSTPGTYFFRYDPHRSRMVGDFIVTGPDS
ncbi:plastocyanin/azurin family copper-binding protein [Chloroflexota bacterium]